MRRAAIISGLLAGALHAAADLRLPTENHHLFTDEPDRFYMHVDRIFEGVASKPWEGGAYGFVRTPLRIGGQVVLTKFHEGIDIAPLRRDKAGNPLDLVCSISAGRVVYVSDTASRSNYGKYVVVAHDWEGSEVLSLYAHLADITCKPGDRVQAGSVLGRLGYTGAGINRVRAHLHLELGMLLSRRYPDWHASTGKGTNHHGLYNGMNIAGSDVAAFYLTHRNDPSLSFSRFIGSKVVHFKVAVPMRGTPDFVSRHPWIRRDGPADAASWEISFSATGLPLAFTPVSRSTDRPVVTSIRPSEIPQRHLTRGLISGTGNEATLTRGGLELLSLMLDDFPPAANPTD
jgi:murein DD-endopeptidase MepM/ murein hydrolase activator NlpD